MTELALFRDARPLLADPAALRAAAEQDGYLFCPGLLPAEPVLAVRAAILELVREAGWIDRAEVVREGPPLREGDPEYLLVYDRIQRLESFHALAHRPEPLALLARLFGESVLVHPRNIARVMWPGSAAFTTPAHQDYLHIQGTEQTWTAWIPLGDCPRTLGGLELLAGSCLLGLLPGHAAAGAGGVGIDTAGLPGEWVGGDLRCGDVLLFHSLTVHRGVPHQTTHRLRLSVDYRYQPRSHPVTSGSLLPHFGRESWDRIYEGWTDRQRQYYWQGYDLQVVEYSQELRAQVLGA